MQATHKWTEYFQRHDRRRHSRARAHTRRRSYPLCEFMTKVKQFKCEYIRAARDAPTTTHTHTHTDTHAFEQLEIAVLSWLLPSMSWALWHVHGNTHSCMLHTRWAMRIHVELATCVYFFCGIDIRQVNWFHSRSAPLRFTAASI